MRKIVAFAALVVALLAAVPLTHAAEREGRVSDEQPYAFIPR
jgi:hypothetical protein